jgi:tRNA-dihydrouridine synthase B
MHWLRTGETRPEPGISAQYHLITEHYEAMLAHYGTLNGVNLMRKHLGWYTKGLPSSAEFRNAVNAQEDPKRVLAMLGEFYAPWIERAAA